MGFRRDSTARNFAYYEARTVRDYLAEAALIGLQDRHLSTRDGLHMGALAGAWIALVAGFGGMQAAGGRLAFKPQLPPAITRMAFRIRYRKRKLRLTITHVSARYELLDGEPLAITHYGEQVLLADKPRQPEGRAPVPHARRVQAGEVPPTVRTNDYLYLTDGGVSSQAAAAHGEADI